MTIARESDIKNLIFDPAAKPSLLVMHQELHPPRDPKENLHPPLAL